MPTTMLQRALSANGSRISAGALRARAEAWRPWRAYAVIQLWRDAAQPISATRRAE